MHTKRRFCDLWSFTFSPAVVKKVIMPFDAEAKLTTIFIISFTIFVNCCIFYHVFQLFVFRYFPQ